MRSFPSILEANNGLRDQEKPLNVIGDACKKQNLVDHLAVSRLLREWPGCSVLVST